MLSHEQQLELFKLLESAASSLRELEGNAGTHSRELNRWQKQAKEARDQLILANQRLVASIAKRYATFGLDDEDLMHEGTLGLMKAIEKFDYHRGFRLSTYATKWIQQAITRAISKQARTIRIPEGQLATLRKLKATAERLRKVLGCEPAHEEIAWAMGLPVSRIRNLLAMDQQTISIHTPLGDADGATIIDFIRDSTTADPAGEANVAIHSELLKGALNTLSEREREVLDLRYGIKDGRPHQLEEIGRHFGVSRERIRQIQNAAEEKLRRFGSARELKCLAQVLMDSSAKAGGIKPAPLAMVPGPIPVTETRVSRLKMRSVEKNENHHLWNNNGVWCCNLVIKTETGDSKRIRVSLQTKNVEEARTLRDEKIRSLCEAFRSVAA
jgi:RNA polymerase sigma factor (sigma-70 family)